MPNTSDAPSLLLFSTLSTGINAVSGLGNDVDSSTIDPGIQDYVDSATQPRLDGICTEPGIVRQVSFIF